MDTVDELKGSYSFSRTSCRWPMTVFYSLLNIGRINSYIIVQDNTGEKMSRRNFLKELSKELCMDYMKKRLQNKNISHNSRAKIIQFTQAP